MYMYTYIKNRYRQDLVLGKRDDAEGADKGPTFLLREHSPHQARYLSARKSLYN